MVKVCIQVVERAFGERVALWIPGRKDGRGADVRNLAADLGCCHRLISAEHGKLEAG